MIRTSATKYLVALPIVLAASSLFATQAHAALVDFNTDASYDNNFVELLNPGTASRNAGGYLLKSTASNAVTTLIYNDSATGGTAGSGGTTFGSPRDTFGGELNSGSFTVQTDFLFTAGNNGNSLGFYFKVPDANNNSYAVLFRVTNNDVRFVDSGGNPTSGTIGSVTQTNVFPALSTNTWYTAQVHVVDIGSTVEFTASLFNQGGPQIGSSFVWTDTTSPLLGAGQVGMRLGANSGNLQVDNFILTLDSEPEVEVPEPASLGILALGGLALLGRRRK